MASDADAALDGGQPVFENVRAFGATGSAMTTRGAIASGSTSLLLKDPADFKDGQTLSILGAGALSDGAVAPLNARIVSGGGTTALVLDTDAATSTPNVGTSAQLDFTYEYDFGLVKHNDAPAIQAAVDRAAELFNFAYPPIGNFPSPIVYFPPGSYRVSSTVLVPPGIALQGASGNTNTEDFTRIIMDKENLAGPPYRTPMFEFTRTQNGVIRATYATWRVEDLAFWWVTGGAGGTFEAPLNGTGIVGNADGSPPYRAGSLLFGELDLDVRITNCTFEHSPAGIYLDSGGVGGAGGVHGMFVENSEFDSGLTGIYAANAQLGLTITDTEFFENGDPLLENVTGTVVISDSQFLSGARVTVRDSHLAGFQLTGGMVQPIDVGDPSVSIDRADNVQISDLLDTGAGPGSFIRVRNALAGSIADNVITNSGFNASPPTGPESDPSWVAAIRIEGSTNVVITGNSITTPGVASYNGFGIFSIDSVSTPTSAAQTSKDNLVSNNIVNAGYVGAEYRGQDRRINLAPGDVASDNINEDGM